MTSCADVRENISAYADNELDINERQLFEEHISNCPSCREELEDMLRIIAICKSMPQQELPEGFKAELHEKLTAVSDRRENLHVVREKPKKVIFTRTIASIAAGILLIFLGGGIVRFGLFSGNLMSKTADSSEMMPATPSLTAAPDEENTVFSFDAMTDSAANQLSAPPAESGAGDANMDFGIMANEQPMEAPPKSFAVDRSVANEARDDGSYKAMDNEAAARKSSTITVMVAKDMEVETERINELASVNNGMMPAGDEVLNGSHSSPDMAMVSLPQDEARKQLQYVFTDEDFSVFLATLFNTYGQADVQVGAYVTEDMTDTMNMLIDQSVLIDAEIQNLQTNNSSKSQEEINRIKKEKEKVDGQIEEIRLNSDFMTVTVYVALK